MAPLNDEDQLPPKAHLRLFNTLSKPKISRIKGDCSKDTTCLKQIQAVAGKNTRKKQSVKCSKEPVASARVEKQTGSDRSSKEDCSLKKRSAMFVRKPGETRRAYLQRIDEESNIRISNSLRERRNASRKR